MDLNSAILAFSEWEYPWKFKKAVESSLSIDQKSKFDLILETANSQDIWLQNDLIIGCKIAQKLLKESFSELHEESVAAIVRAVSYQWR